MLSYPWSQLNFDMIAGWENGAYFFEQCGLVASKPSTIRNIKGGFVQPIDGEFDTP